MNRVRSGLLGGSLVLGALGMVAGGSTGVFSPTACVSPAFLVALAVLPTDILAEVVKGRLNVESGGGGRNGT